MKNTQVVVINASRVVPANPNQDYLQHGTQSAKVSLDNAVVQSLWLPSAVTCVTHRVRDAGFRIVYPYLARHSCRLSSFQEPHCSFYFYLCHAFDSLRSCSSTFACWIQGYEGISSRECISSLRMLECDKIYYMKYEHPAARSDRISEARAYAFKVSEQAGTVGTFSAKNFPILSEVNC